MSFLKEYLLAKLASVEVIGILAMCCIALGIVVYKFITRPKKKRDDMFIAFLKKVRKETLAGKGITATELDDFMKEQYPEKKELWEQWEKQDREELELLGAERPGDYKSREKFIEKKKETWVGQGVSSIQRMGKRTPRSEFYRYAFEWSAMVMLDKKEKGYLKPEGFLSLLDYEELQQARESSKQANRFAIAALVVTIIVGLAQIAVQ